MTQLKRLELKGHDGDAVAEDYAITELIEKFPGQWILLSVTAYNDRDEPSRGVVVAKYKSRKQLSCWIEQSGSGLPAERGMMLFFSSAASLPKTSFG